MLMMAKMAPMMVAPEGAAGLSIVYNGYDENTASQSTYYFTNIPAGDPSADRIIVLVFSGVGTGVRFNSAPEIADSIVLPGHRAETYGGNGCLMIARREVPSGTTCTGYIAPDEGSMTGCRVDCWSVYGATMPAANQQIYASMYDNSGNDVYSEAALPNIIQAVLFPGTGRTWSWDKATEVYDTTFDSAAVIAGAIQSISGIGTATISGSATTTPRMMVEAEFAPAE